MNRAWLSHAGANKLADLVVCLWAWLLFYIDTGARGKSVILMSVCSHILVLLITCCSSCWLVYIHALHSALEISAVWLAELLLPSQWLVWTPLFFLCLLVSLLCLCTLCFGLQEVWMQVLSKQSKPMQFTCFLWPIKRFLGLCWLRYASSISCFALLCNIYVELHFIFLPALYGLFDSMKLMGEVLFFTKAENMLQPCIKLEMVLPYQQEIIGCR